MSRVNPVLPRRWEPLLVALLLGGTTGSSGQMAQGVERGVEYLKRGAPSMQVGETALAALSMIKAGVAADDPALVGCLTKLRGRFSGSYNPERSTGHEIYEAAVVILALANHDAEAWREELRMAAQFL